MGQPKITPQTRYRIVAPWLRRYVCGRNEATGKELTLPGLLPVAMLLHRGCIVLAEPETKAQAVAPETPEPPAPETPPEPVPVAVMTTRERTTGRRK